MAHNIGLVSMVILATLSISAVGACSGNERSTGATPQTISLNGCAIVADRNQPAYVRHMLQDLRSCLADISGLAIPVRDSLNSKDGVVIAVGPKVARELTGTAPSSADLGDEGYIIKSLTKDGREYLVVTGAHPHGTKFAIAAFTRMISARGNTAYIEGPVDLTSRPSFAVRGMHFNGWAFNYPYTFRSWSEKDWKSYLDVLTYSGVNLLYIWPFMEIMPLPLSSEDTAYLQEVRCIIDYAQKEHGMQVWIMEAANRVTTSDLGVRDPRHRPYWRLDIQLDRNPAVPAEFDTIMKSHEALYKIVDNMDGVCIIDSDPGGWPDSPVSDFTKIFRGCRDLLDKHSKNGKKTRLINWMWCGWGRTQNNCFSADFMGETIRAMKSDVPEPWMLISGIGGYLPVCRDEQVIGKTVYLPYNTIETEPSYPATNIGIDGMRRVFDGFSGFASEVGGVMGNVQTPLLQFPHVFYWNSTAWDYEYRNRSEKDVLLDVSEHLYPEQKELIADCYEALKSKDPERTGALADKLDFMVSSDKLGRPGVFGRKLFPDTAIVARSLVMQLRLKSAQERLLRDAPQTISVNDASKLVEKMLDAYLEWDTAHGWHDLWKSRWELGNLSSDVRFPAAAVGIRRVIGSEDEIDPFLKPVDERLSLKYGMERVKVNAIEPVRKALLSASAVTSLAQKAKASASVEADPNTYPVRAANDGYLATLYWPGALVESNTEWLQLSWDQPQTFSSVKVYFLKHPSMHGRTIHLQKETAPSVWEDFAAVVISEENDPRYCIAKFDLESPVTLNGIRIVNLLDVFEVEVN
ncbi:MAG: hypothetical protein ACYC27_11525 [Armatimonadota bacterium]